ncbi:MAG: class I SAM-dependent methyltransferase, partial [Oscillatoriales cyanobacterium]
RRITFAHYMDLALYHPDFGYYSRGHGLGATGDFATSVHLCADFGELIAVQLLDMWQQLGRPDRFDLVEMGAGQGILAGDVLRYLKREALDCFHAIHYRIVEKSASLRRVQQQQLAELQTEVAITWCDLDAIAEASIVGCCFSNELLDAFPVHRVRVCTAQDKMQLQEVYVTYDQAAPEAGCTETIAELSTPELAQYFIDAGIDLCNTHNNPSDTAVLHRATNRIQHYPEGYTTEVNLAAKDWMRSIARILDHGYVLTIDYGYDTDRYYVPYRHDGTLNCYYQHQHHPDPYQNLGLQDITAHVDFGTIERWGAAHGLTTLGRVPQALFLMALGLGDRLSTLGQGDPPPDHSRPTATAYDITQIFQRHQVLRDLINPQGLGGFQVLIQQKCDRPSLEQSSLAGLAIPAMP